MKNYQQEIRGEVIPDINRLKRIESSLFETKIEFLALFDSWDREYISSHIYFAGGCIYSLYNNKTVNDYDIFCDDINAVQFICNKVPKDYLVCETENALSIHKLGGSEFQLIKKFYGEPDGVVGQFDFYHNHFAFVGGKIISFHNWRYIDTKKLCFNFNRARDIGNVLLRIPKFIEKGFKIYKSDHARILLMALENANQEIESLKSAKEHY